MQFVDYWISCKNVAMKNTTTQCKQYDGLYDSACTMQYTITKPDQTSISLNDSRHTAHGNACKLTTLNTVHV